MLVLKNLTSHGERLLDAFPADTHSYLLPLLIDMLFFTDDIHNSQTFSIFYHCMPKV